MSSLPRQPLQFVAHSLGAPTDPTIIDYPYEPLRIVVAPRAGFTALEKAEWGVSGVYLLLGPGSEPGLHRARAGKSGNLHQRVSRHLTERDWVERVVLVRRSSFPFDSAEIGWLEGRLHNLIHDAAAIEREDGTMDDDQSIHESQRTGLLRIVGVIAGTLDRIGVSTLTSDELRLQPSARRRRQTYTITLADLVAEGILSVGDTLLPPAGSGRPGVAVIHPEVELGGKSQVTVQGVAGVDETQSLSLNEAGRRIRYGAEPRDTQSQNAWEYFHAEDERGVVTRLDQFRARLENARAARPPRVPDRGETTDD